jgi:outer membrane protein OmpA-like peptidoglycan-associated protein
MKRFSLLFMFATACAARQVDTSNELIQARQAYAQASQGNAAVEAPKSLRTARATLNEAEQAHSDAPGSQREKELAYVALRRAQAAIAEGNALAARRDAESARNDLRVTSEQAARALEQARADAEAAKAQAQTEAQQRQVAEQDAANVRMSLEQTEAALADVRRQLTAQGTTIDDQTRKLKERESTLQAQLDAMRTERDKAQHEQSRAQAERDQALAEMRRLGDVAEQSDKSLVLTLGSEVMFRSRQAALLPRAKEKLDRLAEALQTLGSDQTFVIEGHTDSKGSAGSNLRLSKLRALAVRSYLIKRGVDPDRIRAEGRGEEEPVASNRDAEGRANNRRVEIVVTPPTVSRR